MKPAAALPGKWQHRGLGRKCAATGKAMKQSRQDLLAPGLAWRTAGHRGAWRISHREEKRQRTCRLGSHTKDFLLVDGVLSIGAVRDGLALEALKGLMEDLLPVGRPRREGGEVVIGAPLALLLPPPGGELRQVDDGRVGVLKLCHGDRRRSGELSKSLTVVSVSVSISVSVSVSACVSLGVEPGWRRG